MRKTKIICTIGPSTYGFEKLKKLADSGMNVARLNFSHADHDWHRSVIKHIRTLNEKHQYSIAIMLDTKGSEIRCGDMKQEVRLKKGDEFTFTIRREAEYEANCTEVSYDSFIDDVKVGDTILIDGGMMSFKVKEKTETDLITESLDDGAITSRRHVNVRGKSAKLPTITEKDWVDIEFGIKEGVDFIALSFVKSSKAIKELKAFLKKKKAPIDVIAKIESAASIPYLEAIIKASDGALVARGDLGSEVPLEEVPLIQEDVVNLSRKHNKPVIVATHLLESMIVNPTPTRAEVTDITEAVKERADGIMLSGETATGKYPFKAIAVMDVVARRIERKLSERKKIEVPPSDDPKEQVNMSAAIMGNNMNVDALLVFTRSGYMGSLLSRTRPIPPIFAFTNVPRARRQLSIYWGVTAFRIDFSSDPEKTIQRAIQVLKSKKLLKSGNQIVVVSDILAGEELVDTVQIRNIE